MLKRCLLILVAVLSTRSHGDGLIRTPDDLRAACAGKLDFRPFSFEGTVTIPAPFPLAPMYVNIGGTETRFYDTRSNRIERIKVGDRVRVSGRTTPDLVSSSTTPNCYKIDVLSHGTLPNIPPVDIRRFRTTIADPHRRTAIRGTLQEVFPDDLDEHFAYIALRDGRDVVYLVCNCPQTAIPAFRALRGTEVVASGIPSFMSGQKSRFLGPTLLISGTNALRVVKQPDRDPFDVPELCTKRTLDLVSVADNDICLVRGTVVATWRGDSLLLRTRDGQSVRIVLSEGPLPAVHTAIEAIGQPETDLYDVSLSQARWRMSPDQSPVNEPPPENSTLRKLFTTAWGLPTINIYEHGKILRIAGIVKSVLQDEHGDRRFLLADDGYAILVNCESAQNIFDEIREGCRVEVSAACIKESDTWHPNAAIPKVRGLFLVLRDAKDIRILAQPPWWTPARFLFALGVLASIIVAILLWNVTLRHLVKRRSREVIRAQKRRIASELHLRERTRLAAEIHDTLSQNLTVVAYQVSAVKNTLAGRDKEIDDTLDIVAKTLKSFRTDLWRCMWDLRNDVLDELNFAEAIRKTVAPVSGDAILNIRFVGRRDLISDSTAHAILCVLRELVANATIHGHARRIRIAGESRHDGIRLSVQDDGTGFDTQARPGMDEGHFGLDGIAERIRRLGGTFEIESAPGKGAHARLSFRLMTAGVKNDRKKGWR